MIVEALGLRGKQAGLRHARLHRKRDARGEPAARRGHGDDVGGQSLRRQILDDLAAGSALPCDDERIVIGRHQRRVALLGDILGDGLAVFASAVVEHDLRAESHRALPLRARCIRRHDDDGRHAEKRRRRRDPLRVIARGKRHHAAGALRLRD